MTRNMVGRARRLCTELAFKPKPIIGEEILKHNALTKDNCKMAYSELSEKRTIICLSFTYKALPGLW